MTTAQALEIALARINLYGLAGTTPAGVDPFEMYKATLVLTAMLDEIKPKEIN